MFDGAFEMKESWLQALFHKYIVPILSDRDVSSGIIMGIEEGYEVRWKRDVSCRRVAGVRDSTE
jgi:hypothetical protein